MGATKK